MARFIGSVQGNRGSVTRLGHPGMMGITVLAASYAGGCRVTMRVRNGLDYLRIELVPHRGAGDSLLIYDGPLTHAAESLRHCHHADPHAAFLAGEAK